MRRIGAAVGAVMAALAVFPVLADATPPELRQKALEATVASLEQMVAGVAATDDAALTDAILVAFRSLAEADGNACELHQESLDEDAEVLRMATLLMQALGLEVEVTPQVATMFTTSRQIRTMINTLKDQAGSLPGTADYLKRIDAVKVATDVMDDRFSAAMQQAIAEGRASFDGDLITLKGEGCPA
jgi:hypothetical protein